MPTPVILDVDTGIDDALAIALAVHSPAIDIVAATTVAGNVSIDHTTQNTLDVLAFLGAGDVPVYRGASRPLARPLTTARNVHGSNGLGGCLLPTAVRTEEAAKGPATIVRLAQVRPAELTLICVGPLTNLAIALSVEPALPRLLKKVVIMGGAFLIQGNYNKAAEFNFYVDPEAAEQVFSAPFADVTVLGLDVTHNAPIPFTWWQDSGREATPEQALLHRIFAESFATQPDGRHYMHDAMAIAATIDPSIVVTERHSLAIGGTFDDRGASRLAQHTAVNVALEVDTPRFLRMMADLFSIDG
ncbi:MAG: nucleoside hydrolase [Thermomicrobiales bacterium]|nr:nucleoside hydrolase [Thermomicrobiales bacterium]